ncbi:MAG: DNA repair protein RecN [Bacteroidetes bacterium]|nr:DNA repair protein RecN [Bacteroidota bacterium]
MLKHISIKNFVLIKELKLEFTSGLSVITGETGAGKSIMLDALQLLLGARADSSVIRKGEKKCVIEGVFHIDKSLKSLFKEYDVDFEEDTILRREISDNGKSRSFANDTPVTLPFLKAIAQNVVDIHSQHAFLSLKSSGFILDILDGLAGSEKQLGSYSTALHEYKELSRLLEKEEADVKQSKENLDYWKFKFTEIEAANLEEGEEESVENDLKILENSGEVRERMERILQYLNSEDSALDKLISAETEFEKLERLTGGFSVFVERIRALRLEAEDVAAEVEKQSNTMSFDKSKLVELQDRQNLIYGLLKKYNLVSAKDLLNEAADLKGKISGAAYSEERLEEFRNKKKVLHKSLLDLSAQLSKARKKAAPQLIKQIVDLLAQLKMSKARVEVDLCFSPNNNFSESGQDKPVLMFSANQGEDLKAIEDAASGGELSRVMLAVKSCMAKHFTLPAIIFDEIDTGVSGEVAHKMGLVLQEMGKNMQVIAISHLPQIASKAQQHYRVEKSIANGMTESKVYLLNEQQRIEEIAQMLSGDKLTKKSLENAKELLGIV